ncbi:MAG: hypothetical protein HKP58_03135 [Desulfatitalea sp.]|nr:hypothetical protein [Desulfatitalea sp.]NNJ99386.1 hypothetical protein [Desulfatitalea sp.]
MEKKEIPTLSDGPSQQGFYVGLYLEHLEECSFLYEQRLTLFEDPEICWTDIEDFEERFEAHVDAFVIGEQLALDVCRMRAAEGDFGELHAALRVFCRQKRMDYLQEALEGADINEDTMTAITEALKHELPEDWHDLIGKMLSFDAVDLIRIGAIVTGFKRLPFERELLKLLYDKKIAPVPEVIHALGRIGGQSAQHDLLGMLADSDNRVAHESALALLRLGAPQIIDNLLKKAHQHDWPLMLIGIAGKKEHAAALHDIYHHRGKSADLLLALGFLGDPASIPILMDNLADGPMGATSALALNLITGANLYEEVFIPEAIDEDTLFEDELEKVKKGASPDADAEPAGAYVFQLSTNPESWRTWWRNNAERFDPSLCHRNGRPFTPAGILENLMSDQSPHAVRQWAAEEWAIKTGQNLTFETDFPVSIQKKVLAGIDATKR